ncbi:MAG: hypothetical protein N2114_04250 [Candidatus Goldbacteria bacterium]|nr:hypothetical protein [Candidatus Goldiibacteriota bacterium]
MHEIDDDLKELLSFHEMLALLCFNINFAKRYETYSLNQISDILNITEDRIEKAVRIFWRIGLAKIYKDQLNRIIIEMTDTNDFIVKNTVFEVIWENKRKYSEIYQKLIQHTIEQNHRSN